MSRTANRVSLLGLFLIAFGLVILLKKFHVIHIQSAELVWPLLAIMGLFLTGRGLIDNKRGKIVWGTVLFLYSIFFFLRSLDTVYVPIDLILPATFMIFGIVGIMLFVSRPGDWYFLIPGLLLLAVGASVLLSEYGYWYGWEMRQFVKTWWPAALVLFGAGMILRHRKPKPADDGPVAPAPGPEVPPETPGATGEADRIDPA